MADRFPRATEGFTLDPGPNGARLTAPNGARHYLNATAAVVYLFCDGAHDVEAIASALAEHFGLEAPPVADVDKALAELAGFGAIQLSTLG